MIFAFGMPSLWSILLVLSFILILFLPFWRKRRADKILKDEKFEKRTLR